MNSSHRNDLTGKKFNEWEVLKEITFLDCKGFRAYKLLCKCSCGRIVEQFKSNITSGSSKRCDICRATKVVVHTKIYKHLQPVWVAMRQRCNNPNNEYFHNYGGRGVKVCKEWEESLPLFLEWAEKNRWEEGLQLDRKHNDKDYSPANCRFITQAANLRNCRLLSNRNTSGFRGVSKLTHKTCIKYKAVVVFCGVNFRLGHFTSVETAALARDNFIKVCKIPHKLNFEDPEFDREMNEIDLDEEECLKRAKEELKRIRRDRGV